MIGPASEYIPQAGIMSFAPINAIHQHLAGLHVYAGDHSAVVPAHHFCSCAPKHPQGTVRQCIIYDSDKANARLIGIEYVIDEDVFMTLDDDEKKFWHSHKYEVESGMLCLKTKKLVPTLLEDQAEKDAMTELHKTYGKTIHTWSFDSSPDLPLGPPKLMHGVTEKVPVSQSVIDSLGKVEGHDLEHKRKHRQTYLDYSYTKAEGADGWEEDGKGLKLEAKEVEFEKPGEGGAMWKGKEDFEDVLRGEIQNGGKNQETSFLG
jgi:hypothetical protein